MRKKVYLFVATILIAVAVIWNFYYADYFKSFYFISEWGAYLLSVPIVFCLIFFFSTTNLKSEKIIVITTLGVFTTFLLSRDFQNSFWVQKIIITFVGAIITWLLAKKPKSNDE